MIAEPYRVGLGETTDWLWLLVDTAFAAKLPSIEIEERHYPKGCGLPFGTPVIEPRVHLSSVGAGSARTDRIGGGPERTVPKWAGRCGRKRLRVSMRDLAQHLLSGVETGVAEVDTECPRSIERSDGGVDRAHPSFLPHEKLSPPPRAGWAARDLVRPPEGSSPIQASSEERLHCPRGHTTGADNARGGRQSRGTECSRTRAGARDDRDRHRLRVGSRRSPHPSPMVPIAVDSSGTMGM